MPRIAPNFIARIAKGLVLEAIGIETDRAPVRDKRFAIARNEMRHWPSHPDVSVQPQAAGHRVCHPCSAVFELTPLD